MLIVAIHREDTGTDESANYSYVVLVNRQEIHSGKVLGHNRQDGWPALLQQLLDQLDTDKENE